MAALIGNGVAVNSLEKSERQPTSNEPLSHLHRVSLWKLPLSLLRERYSRISLPGVFRMVSDPMQTARYSTSRRKWHFPPAVPGTGPQTLAPAANAASALEMPFSPRSRTARDGENPPRGPFAMPPHKIAWYAPHSTGRPAHYVRSKNANVLISHSRNSMVEYRPFKARVAGSIPAGSKRSSVHLLLGPLASILPSTQVIAASSAIRGGVQ